GTITAGQTFVAGLVRGILGSPRYAPSTLILLTWDESGGDFCPLPPPPGGPGDGAPPPPPPPPPAPRPLPPPHHPPHPGQEHASIGKCIEWNWPGAATGQLGGRDATASNIGSLLDPARTGVAVPED